MSVAITQLADPSIGGTVQAFVTGIDATGEAVGYAVTSSGYYGVTWQSAQSPFIDLSTGPAVNVEYPINDQGEIVTSTAAGVITSRNSVVTSLTLIGTGDFANGINDQGAVVGQFTNAAGFTRAVEWQNGVATELVPLIRSYVVTAYTAAYAINGSGQAVGESNSHAVLWQNGTATDLGALSAIDESAARAINNQGVIVGTDLDAALGATTVAVIWQHGVLSRLATLPGAYASYAGGINDSGVVVGAAGEDMQHFSTAVAWIDGAMIDLNTLLPADSGWVLKGASAINDSGVIVGRGTYNGVASNFELTLGANPTPLYLTASAVLAVEVTTPVAVRDSAANIGAHFDALEKLDLAGMLSSITLTDSGTPILSIPGEQSAYAASLFTHLETPYAVQIVPTSSGYATGAYGAVSNTLLFDGSSSAATIAFQLGEAQVTSGGLTESLDDIQAVKFSDLTLIVANPPGTNGVVTSGNVTELYAAVLGREPDLAGLTFYERYLGTHFNTPLLQFAEWFLASSEYVSAHDYAETTLGDAQFITDSYQNLLHRTPTAAEITFYQTTVMTPALKGLTVGTQAYHAAEFQAHAQMLVYFSASAEFLTDVQITAAHPASAQHWLLLSS